MKKLLISVLSTLLIIGMFVSCYYEPIEKEEVVLTPEEQVEKGTITTLDGLLLLKEKVNGGDSFEGKTILLEKDLDLTDTVWEPIGSGNRDDIASAKVFSGTFDGNGHIIKGLSNKGYDPSSTAIDGEYSFGLFGIVKGATIKNLKLVDVSIDTLGETYKGNSVGALVGYAYSKATVEDCSVSGSIIGKDVVAAIIGRAYGTSGSNPDGEFIIRNCVNNATVKSNNKTGGILGMCAYLKNENEENCSFIENCVNNGIVEGGDYGTGGIVGYISSAKPYLTIRECKNTANLGDENKKYVGGIVGYISGGDKVKIEGCENSGNIVAKNEAGGIFAIAHFDGATTTEPLIVVKNCANSGSIKSINENAGGITGYIPWAYITIEDCSSSATIEAAKYAGGIVGRVEGSVVMRNSSGGKEAIKGTLGSGRLVGQYSTYNNVPQAVFTLSDNDDGKDIPTFAVADTYVCTIEISAGTLFGVPAITPNLNGAVILFKAGTKWQKSEGEILPFEVDTKWG